MKYIIFDMEWNQPSSPEEKNPSLPHGEIIQLGYFVLDEKLETLCDGEIPVKPVCYPVMNAYVSALTGITQRQAELGLPFPEAMAEMAKHFDGDTVLFTWGDDDMPILRENLAFHKIDISLPAHYNLQRFFSVQAETPQRQIGLKTAAEHFGINADVQSHDALNDAYITLLIARKLDIPRGISEYAKMPKIVPEKNRQQPWLSEEAVFTESSEYSGNMDGMAAFCRSLETRCPVCGEKLETDAFCRHGKTSFLTKALCPADGAFFLRFEKDEGLVKTEIYRLTDTLERVYKSRLRRKEKGERYRKMYRQRHGEE